MANETGGGQKAVDPEREKRIKDLLGKMSLGEKVGQMSPSTRLFYQAIMVVRYNYVTFDAGPNRRLGIPPMRFSDGPRGITVGHSTCFPVSMCRGATFDMDLEERVGEAMGIEARSQGANFFGGVCINLLRHPGWGRAQETFGEDPFHLGAMGVAMIRGLQRHVMACAKHYAMNSIEESRFFVDVQADERTLHEIYLYHFKKCVEAGVAAVMSAYNKVGGKLCGHNRRLLREILKDEWGFTGFVISDFLWGVRDTVEAAGAGLDIEMPMIRFYGRKLKEAVERGDVPESSVDDSVLRILRQKDRFRDVGQGPYGRDRIACPEHVALALEAARKGMVLLKNENQTLPLDRSRIKTLAVIGRLAQKANLGDMGSSRVRPPNAVTPLQGIMAKAGKDVKVVYCPGDDLEQARRAAAGADAVVVVAGLNWKIEGEFLPIPFVRFGGDRMDLRLPADQEALISAVAAANGRCVVAVEAGSAVIMEAWKDKVPAIIMAWYPGMEGGTALAEIVFGDVNPSGRLPAAFPRSHDQLPFFDNKVKKIEYGFYHGYRLFDKEGLESAFHFGHGLSYTTYEYSDLRLGASTVGRSGRIEVEVDVRNAGSMAGEEVVQVYTACRGSKVERPRKELKAFTRVALEPGGKKTATLVIDCADLAFYNADARKWEVEEAEYELMAGPSSDDRELKLRRTFTVKGD